MSITKLTDSGKAFTAAISPDGKYVVHVVSDAGLQSLWIRHIATNSNTQITPPTESRYSGLTFSPDGNYIYFTRNDKARPGLGLLYQRAGKLQEANANLAAAAALFQEMQMRLWSARTEAEHLLGPTGVPKPR